MLTSSGLAQQEVGQHDPFSLDVDVATTFQDILFPRKNIVDFLCNLIKEGEVENIVNRVQTLTFLYSVTINCSDY